MAEAACQVLVIVGIFGTLFGAVCWHAERERYIQLQEHLKTMEALYKKRNEMEEVLRGHVRGEQ